jgi:hypothetical protein
MKSLLTLNHLEICVLSELHFPSLLILSPLVFPLSLDRGKVIHVNGKLAPVLN